MLEKVLQKKKARGAVTRADLIQRICETSQISRTDAREVLDCFLDQVVEALVEEKSLTFRGFAHFQVLDKSPRKTLNPRTGETCEIPALRSVSFRAGKLLKQAVREGMAARGGKREPKGG